MSKVMSNGNGRIKFPINEPAQRQEEVADRGVPRLLPRPGRAARRDRDRRHHHDGPRRCRARGVEFLRVPAESYYETVLDRVGKIDEDIAPLAELGILVDRDDEGYLLQIFTKPVQDRPTLFYEIIQRKGAKSFGAGNFKALFEAIEREQDAPGEPLACRSITPDGRGARASGTSSSGKPGRRRSMHEELMGHEGFVGTVVAALPHPSADDGARRSRQLRPIVVGGGRRDRTLRHRHLAHRAQRARRVARWCSTASRCSSTTTSRCSGRSPARRRRARSTGTAQARRGRLRLRRAKGSSPRRSAILPVKPGDYVVIHRNITAPAGASIAARGRPSCW
ncbi:MAG: hypothetical protein V9E87_16580 [Gemmatimonadales bacterium]